MLKECPVCSSANIDTYERRLNIYRCLDCLHIFAMLSDEIRETYNEDYFAKTHKNWFDNPDYYLLDIAYNEISRLIKEKKFRLLDAGCGKGAFLRYVSEKNSHAELFGIDLTSNRHPRINFIQGDIFKERIDVKFNVISSLFVVEHIDRPQLFVKKLKGMLNPRGIIIIMTVNSNGLIYKIARLLDRAGIHTAYERLYSAHNLQYYTPRSLRMLIEANGLEVLSHRTNGQSLSSVDLPERNVLVNSVFKFFLWWIFMVSSLLKKEIFQTIVCRIPEGAHSDKG